MSDEKIIPTDAPEADNEATTPAEAAEVVNDTPEETSEVENNLEESAEVVEETSEEPSETPEESSEAEGASIPEEPVAAPVRATPLTALSARPERSASRGQSDNRGGNGGDRGGRRDARPAGGGDRRGGKSGFEPVKKEFEEVLLEVGRVTKVTSGGRQLRFRAAVVIGDRNGRVGFGLGKAREVSIAVEKAVNSAKRNLITVPLENGTVPYQVETKFKAVKIMIHPATEGTGIIAGGSARRILELAGCQNILSKRHGGRNVITTAYATIEALKKYQIKN